MSGTVSQPGVVVFDYAAWATTYPALAVQINASQAEVYFAQAELILNNTPHSIVRDLNKRAILLGLLVAHLAQLYLPSSMGGNGGAVGRTNSASRGSVSVSLEMGPATERAAWYMQTQYGAQYWAMTRNLRQARYIPGGPQFPRIWP